MKTITKILTVLLFGCSFVYGYTKDDVSDFKKEFPKTKENVTSHLDKFFTSLSCKSTIEIPFVKIYEDTEKVGGHTVGNGHYYLSDYLDMKDYAKLYPFSLGRVRFARRYASRRDYDAVLKDLPRTFEKEITENIPIGSYVTVDFVIFHAADSELDKLSFRTYNSDVKNIPIKFRELKEKCFKLEKAKIDKIMNTAMINDDGYVFVTVETQTGVHRWQKTTSRGWVRLSDLMKNK